MKKIYLVRHGQASFGLDHYDQLSANGEKQAALLADYWKNVNLKPSSWLSGTLKRQQQTRAFVQDVIAKSEPVLESDLFNEFPAEDITAHYLPQVVASKNDPSLTKEKIFSDNLIFQQLFGEVLKTWIQETNTNDFEFESFADFSQRVESSIEQLKNIEFEDSLAVFSSAGVIAAICYRIINNQSKLDMQMFKIAWNIINSSVTEIRLNKGQLYLHNLNQYAHLDSQPELITYR